MATRRAGPVSWLAAGTWAGQVFTGTPGTSLVTPTSLGNISGIGGRRLPGRGAKAYTGL